MKIDYKASRGEQLTLEKVDSFSFVGATYVGMTVVAILRIGTEELLATEFTASDD